MLAALWFHKKQRYQILHNDSLVGFCIHVTFFSLKLLGKLTANSFDFRFDWISSNRCTKPENGSVCGNTLESVYVNVTCGEIDLRSHPVKLLTFRNTGFKHKHDCYMPPTRQTLSRQNSSDAWCERIRTPCPWWCVWSVTMSDTVPVVVCGQSQCRTPCPWWCVVSHNVGYNVYTDYSPHAAFAQRFFHIG